VTVLYFADTRFPIERANGVQTMETCHALARRGHRVILAVRPDTAVPPRDPFEFYGLPRVASLQIHRIPRLGTAKARRLRFLVAAVRLTQRHRDAIVYTRDLGLAAWLLRLPRSRRPSVLYESHGVSVTVAEEMPLLLGKPSLAPTAGKLARLDRREALVWTRASAYVTITHALAEELRHRYGARERVFVIPDGARPAAAADRPTGPSFVAAYAGHLYPWKGVDVFVRALALVPGVDGLIVGGHPGEADLERVERLAAELGLGPRLTITRLLPPQEVAGALRRASVLVLPNPASAISERYTSPLKLFEYLAVGRPIIASDLTALREVLTDGTTALLVAPGDPGALARAIDRLRADPALASRLAEAARALAPRYSWDARAARIEGALDAVRAS
jgi:glycosyltransferase involved in cell wall biosynthesis